MNKEQIIDEAYNNFVTTVENNRPEGYTREVLTQEEFVKNSIIDPYFSIHWGLKIDYCNKLCDKHNVPTKLITITYKDTIIESYENNS